MTTIQSTTQTSDQEVNSISPLSEINTQLEGLFAACWKDDAMKQRFMNDPKAVLAEYGMDIPEDIEVNIVENTDTTVYITIPTPFSAGIDLSNEELSNTAGGRVGCGVGSGPTLLCIGTLC